MVDRKLATAFDDADVARAYAFRPAYPRSLYDALMRLPLQRRRILDLGCGTGAIAHSIAPYFDHVDAVDISLPMLRLADDGRHPNITWIHGPAETVELAPIYDLVTAGASIHWMNHAVVFARIASALAEGGVMAVIEGDDVDDAPWRDEWQEFIGYWLKRLGREFDPDGYRRAMTNYQRWMTIAGQRTFQSTVTMDVEHFIACQHSRATWTRARLGAERADQFDQELRDLLLPYTTDGAIRYTMNTQLVWGVTGNTVDI